MLDALRAIIPLMSQSECTVGHAEMSHLPEGAFDLLLEAGILVQAECATILPCPDCFDGHMEEVIVLDGPDDKSRFFIPCPENLRVEVSQKQLLRWKLSLSRVALLLGEAIASGSVSESVVPDRAWRLGDIEIAGDVFGVPLVRVPNGGYDKLVEAISQIVPPTRTILVTVGQSIPPITRFAAVIPLELAFQATGDRITLNDRRIRSAMRAHGDSPGFVFRCRGDFWEVAFAGKSVHLKDLAGFAYLARLLSEPNRDIPAVSLLAARIGIDPRVAAGSSGEVLDDEARETYRHRYLDLQQELAVAKQNNDLLKIETAQSELETLGRELANATGLGGRSGKASAHRQPDDARRTDERRRSRPRDCDETTLGGRTGRRGPR